MQTAPFGDIKGARISWFDRAVGRLPRLCSAGAYIPLTNEAMTKYPRPLHHNVYIPPASGTISKWPIVFCPGAQHSFTDRLTGQTPNFLVHSPNPGQSDLFSGNQFYSPSLLLPIPLWTTQR